MSRYSGDPSVLVSSPPLRRQAGIEVLVFLFLIVPSLVLSLFVIPQGGVGFALAAAATIVRDLALVSLILYFLWRNMEPLAAIGWVYRRFVREIAIGILLFVPVFFGADLLETLLRRAGLSAPSAPLPSFVSPHGLFQAGLALLMVLVVAVAEETIFRGYLIHRFCGVGMGTAAALVLSSVVFALGHGYEGTAGVVTVGTMGLAFALVYLWRKSLVAAVTMHFLQDFLAIVLLPVLGQS